MGTHDPGPWIATQGRISHRWFVETEPEGDCTIALVTECPSAEANARLLAAAPELLEALRTVNRLITEAALTGFNYKDGDWPERLFQSQQQTSRAIIKAQGSLKPDMETTAKPE